MGLTRRTDQYGYGRSDRIPFGIDNGQVTRVDSVDLKTNHALLRVSCDDAQYIPANTTLTAYVASDSTNQLNALWQENGAAVWTSGTLPTSGGFDFVLRHADGIQRIAFVLSNAANGGSVVLHVMGLDPART